jgi:predicted 2-oxoglutarate/Fe(II)-dependent dioxygenase YbiX
VGDAVSVAGRIVRGRRLIIDNDFGQQRIKLDAGDMIVYGAASRHRVTPIVSGERLAGAFWIQSLVRGHAERSMLFELDRSIQRLTQLNTDIDSLARLTAHYHAYGRTTDVKRQSTWLVGWPEVNTRPRRPR